MPDNTGIFDSHSGNGKRRKKGKLLGERKWKYLKSSIQQILCIICILVFIEFLINVILRHKFFGGLGVRNHKFKE